MPERSNNLESGDAVRREEHPRATGSSPAPRDPLARKLRWRGGEATCADMNILEPQ